jgi:UDP-galactopyranose mutase
VPDDPANPVRRRTCVVVGAGLTGATAAWSLATQHQGWDVTICEAQSHVGGQLHAEFVGSIPYEPHGPHIFHTDSEEAYALVRDHCELNGYRHRVVTAARPGQKLLTWPLQLSELEQLEEWPTIRDELDSRPSRPSRVSFEAYATDLMGKTLYEWCVYGYTVKQWGMEPSLLSSSFAPRRLDLRTDGCQLMFRDPYQGWCEGGWHTLVENLIWEPRLSFQLGLRLTLDSLPPADAYVITAPLDEFLDASEPLPWRGVTTVFAGHDSSGPVLPVAVVNYPGLDVPYTRRVETRQMSGIDCGPGTITGYEYPGAPVKHYPVDDAAGENRIRHRELAQQLHRDVPSAVLAGRLATYSYIDMDQAILQGLNAARKIARRDG